MDVDLRQFVALPSTSTTVMNKDGGPLPKGDTDERELKKPKQHSIGGGGPESVEDLSDAEAADPFAKKFDL